MCEVTMLNFEAKYEEIIQDVAAADFLALDCEFSGSGPCSDHVSFFDEPEERYASMRSSIMNLLVTQLGITAFRYDGARKYKTSTYVIYLFPRSYPYSPRSFTCDCRSLQFLSLQNYDFNKTIRDGLTYVMLSQEDEIEDDIATGNIMNRMRAGLSGEEQRLIQDLCRNVYEWLRNTERHSNTFTVVDLSDLDPLQRFLVRDYIELQFKVRTTFVQNFKLKVVRGTRSEAERKSELYQVIMGASSLIKDILKMKRPIVGHNMLMDLMMFYKTFCQPLPAEYDDFKREILEVFPLIYDTKFMAYEMKKRVGYNYLETSLSLQSLHDCFESYQRQRVLPYMPVVVPGVTNELSNTPVLHNSGHYSYLAGHVYLNLAHMFALWDERRHVMRRIPIYNEPYVYFDATDRFQNRINMMRGRIGHFNLGGEEVAKSMPNLLLVETKSGRDIDPQELVKTVERHDSADLRPLGGKRILIASSSIKGLQAIESALRRTGRYKLRWYNSKYKVRMDYRMLSAYAFVSFSAFFFNILSKVI